MPSNPGERCIRSIIPILFPNCSWGWCPAQKCIDNVPEKTKTGHEIVLKVYPGAHHCLDLTALDRTSHGHRLKYNRRAAADAKVQIKEFLAKYLQ
jgi:dienelactone hydrolase